MSHIYPLLLTATIQPHSSKQLVLLDPEKRYKQYIDNLLRFVFESNFTEFVFCENSMYDLQHIYTIKQLAENIGKKVEILQFAGDAAKTEHFTRAYGDQEIMEYAIHHSELINNAQWFYKVTGRYWITNINTILKAWGDKKTVFIRGWLCKKTVHTAFFKSSVPYFYNHFEGKAEQLKKFSNSLEYLYYHYIEQSGIKMSIAGVHPDFIAERWSWGRIDQSRRMKIKTIVFAKLWVYNLN